MYTGLDFVAVIMAAIMILGPMTLGATHAADRMHTATDPAAPTNANP